MHIIAGAHRGRKLATLAGKAIRPTTSRARESLFNILMHRYRQDGHCLIHQARFADICCGSGAVGLEALSRGASFVTFVDASAQAIAIARKNAESLRESGKAEFLTLDVQKLPPARQAYDVIFTDPPYASTLLENLAEQLISKGWMDNHTWLVTEQHHACEALSRPDMQLMDERKYGQSLIRLYQKLLNDA